MVNIKDLLDDLGGGRSVAMGSILVVYCYVAASTYVETVETRLADIEARTRTLEAANQRYDAFEHAGTRFTGEQGSALESRISRLERQLDSRQK